MTCERGNVFHPLVAFIVDQYLSRNQFFQTRAIFRNEASSLFANSSTNENLLSLEEMLNQYVFMKQQNIVLEKEKVMVMQEKNRIQMLLQNMQNALDSFHARSSLSNAATIITNSTIVPPMQSSNRSSPVVASISTVFPMQNTLSLLPIPVDNVSLLSPMIRVLDKKRKDTPIVDGFIVAKKPRDRPLDQKNKFQGIKILLPSPNDKVDFGSNSATAQLVKSESY
ncbi:hypothetical protein VNO80_01464 [Phaseolus coccineus]|uniref:LisH domain-containing protein n=1 Tax=Phaseolus coccineus TaxID=3886 RepID=A0AAN9RST7_PHACN